MPNLYLRDVVPCISLFDAQRRVNLDLGLREDAHVVDMRVVLCANNNFHQTTEWHYDHIIK